MRRAEVMYKLKDPNPNVNHLTSILNTMVRIDQSFRGLYLQ
jgi:hypothetical protein